MNRTRWLAIGGLVCVAVGFLSLFKTLWALHVMRQEGVGAVAGGFSPMLLVVLGFVLLLVAVLLRKPQR